LKHAARKAGFMSLIEVGSAPGLADSFFIREMKDYRKMSRAQLLESIEQIKSQHTRRAKTQRRSAAAALAEQEERLRAILNTAVEGIITIDHHGLIESVNPAVERIFNYSAAELIGANVSLLMPLPHRAHHDQYISSYLDTGRAQIIGIGREVAGRRKDGSVFPMDLSVSEVRFSGRVLFTGFIRDITERKEAEKTLQHYASLVESSDDAIIGKTLDGYVTSWNRGAEAIFGYTSAEMIGRHISVLIPDDRKGEEPAILEKIKRGQSVDHFETIRQCKDGRLIDISVTISPIRDAAGKVIGASKLARDITGRKQLERQILEVSDREQRRIGHDLHDGLCQHLAGIEMMSQVLEKKLAAKSKDGAKRAGDIARHVREAIAQTRALARGLSPVTLESEGLASALNEHAVNIEKIFGVRCRFHYEWPVTIQNPATGSHLFRLAQEAISNALKHGKATEIDVHLKGDPGWIYLGISDNGRGFPAPGGPPAKGMGLRIMSFRAGMIGGTLTVENNPRGGALIMCSAPNLTTPPPAAR
jgi:PAS domain S-box-containing protein